MSCPRFSSAALVLLMTSLGFSQELPLAEQPLDLEVLANWKHRTYTIYDGQIRNTIYNGSKVYETSRTAAGYVTMRTRVTESEIVLEEQWGSCCRRGASLRVALHYLPDDLINIQRMVVWHNDQKSEFDMTRDKFELEIDGEFYAGPWPEGTLARAALMRFVTFLPRDADTRFQFDKFTITPEPYIADENVGQIECRGPASLCFRGRQVECTRYTVDQVDFWVRNEDNVLLRVE